MRGLEGVVGSSDMAKESKSQDTELAIHKMILNQESETTSSLEYMAAIERYLDEDEDREVNEQDSEGMTGLHWAVNKSNLEAVAALLMCGADVNVADKSGKTPYSYCMARCDMRNYLSYYLFYTFLGHVHKLVVLGLPVSEENLRCYGKARAHHVFNDKQLDLGYAVEFDKMEDVRVDERTSLRQLFFEGPHEIATSTVKRRSLEMIIATSGLHQEFPRLWCLVKLQYRRGLARRKLLEPTRNALRELVYRGFEIVLPEPCVDEIVRHLDVHEDLTNLVRAAS